MQNKGVIRLAVLLIGLACVYQLSFTLVARNQAKRASIYAQKAVDYEQTTPAFNLIPELFRASYLDSLYTAKEQYYTDSIMAEKVYIGFTYREVKEKEINLGLDLKGGMNVTLEVSIEDLIIALSNNSTNSYFLQAINIAKSNLSASRTDFIALFGEAWEQVAPGQRMSQVFGTYEMRDRIRPETSNADVLKMIREEAEGAISNSFNVLRNRIRRFGVTQPNIQKIGSTGRILVELPGVKEPARVRKLLQGTASLEFWETYENGEIYPHLVEVNRIVRELMDAEMALGVESAPADGTDEEVGAVTTTESAAEESSLLSELMANRDSLSSEEMRDIFFYMLNPSVYQGQLMPGPSIGIAHYRDTAKIGEWLRDARVNSALPADLIPMWSVNASDPAGVMFELIAIKSTTRDGKAPLDGGVITDASRIFSGTSATPMVDMAMNAEGARTWASMTANNIDKCIAIVLDGLVYSYPRVQTEIANGRSQITGHFTMSQAEDLANVLKSGKLPAPARIVQEAVVGPSLGSESISAGIFSFLIAFVLVLTYMFVFYSGAGLVANTALVTNVLFLFGALVSFGAVLTLPGIAGIVLTLGMAVDANVIINERIKEELRAGKALRAAVSDGYKNAYSAIIDGNLTTIITGIVLAIFGSGPVQSFATTLVIGIITSVITSVFVTRLITDWRLSKNKTIAFDNRLTRNFLQNTKIDFMKIRKYAYIFSAALCIISVGSLLTKGFTYGVDFSGGRTYVISFDRDVTTGEVREALSNTFDESIEVKQFGGKSKGGSKMRITTTYLIEDNSEESDVIVDHLLYESLGGLFAKSDMSFDEFVSTVDNPNGIISSEKVGPSIADDIKRDAVIAVLVSLFAIFAYIAFRFTNWSWGTGGLISIAHDALIVMGFFSLFSGILPFNLDIDQNFIAAILTIIGYSINDSVIIFDRIREYKTLYPKRDLTTNINEALNSTLSRTVNTAGTTLVVLLAIAIFGGDVIRGFAVALILGVAIGTYSSIFVGTPIVYDMHRRREDESRPLKPAPAMVGKKR